LVVVLFSCKCFSRTISRFRNFFFQRLFRDSSHQKR
jgi:hypothetical protein